MSQTAKEYWDNAAKDPDVRNKYIADKWAKTQYFIDMIEKNNTDWHNVLEIGCGIGRLLVPLADRHKNCNFYGVDISDEMIKIAENRPNITYQKYADNLDLVYSMLVFQHVDTSTKKSMLKLAYNYLKKSGVLLFQFVTGNENTPYSYQLHLSKMIDLVSKTGFVIDEITERFVHDSWYVIRAVK